MTATLSVLDLATVVSGSTAAQALAETAALAPEVERLGFQATVGGRAPRRCPWWPARRRPS